MENNMGTAMTDKQNELIVRLRNLKLEGFASEIENQLQEWFPSHALILTIS